MMLAPTPSLSGTVISMPSGGGAPYFTMRVMRRLVEQAKTDPRMIQAVRNIIYLTPEKDEFAEVGALFNYVRDSIRYMRDVFGVEVVSDPFTTLQSRVGDCDDKVTLLSAMIEIAGYPTRFVIAGYSDPSVFEHIYLQAFLLGEWVNCDATEKMPIGYAPPDPIALDVEK